MKEQAGTAIWRPVVVKLGGSIEGASLDTLVRGIRTAVAAGLRPVIVHGGGPRISRALADAGIDAPFVDGQRVTNAAAMEVVDRVLAKEINPELVDALIGHGVDAVGISGSDGVLHALAQPGLLQTGVVGKVTPDALYAMLAQGSVPVVAPIGRGLDGSKYNINADIAAGAIAGAIGAQRVVFFTDVPGIYVDFSAKELLYGATSDELAQLVGEGTFTGGMIPKVQALLSAVEAGVPVAVVVDGRDTDAVAWAVVCEVGHAAEVAVGVTEGTGLNADVIADMSVIPDASEPGVSTGEAHRQAQWWRQPRQFGGTIIVSSSSTREERG